MGYLGSTPTTQSFISGTDYFSGTGAQTAFTLSRTVASVNDIEAVVENVVQRPNDAYTISGTTITFTSAPPSGTNNVYVRYLSTTTQTITPAQNSVSLSSLNSDLQNQWGTGFKNRIINGDMRIDQRNAGAAVTVNANGNFYPVDRYRCTGANSAGVYTLQQVTDAPAGFINSLKATVTTADSTLSNTRAYVVTQIIEGFNTSDLGFGSASAKTVTLSFSVKSSVTGSFSGVIRNTFDGATTSYPFSYTISSANTWEQKSVTITAATSGTRATNNTEGMTVGFTLGASSDRLGTANTWGGNLWGATGMTQLISTLNATFYITGVQLEAGSVATPFERRPYGTELALCQRYYEQYDAGTGFVTGYFGIGMVFGAGGNDVRFVYSFKIPKRTSPTCSASGTMQVSDSGVSTTLTSFIFDGPSINSVLVYGVPTANMNAYRPCQFWRDTASTCSLKISAEL